MVCHGSGEGTRTLASHADNKLKVLLVDDERDVTTMMKTGLEANGFEVETYNSPIQALSQFRPNHYAAIILDVRMSEMTGFELAKEIWAIDQDAGICFLSAYEIYENVMTTAFHNFKKYCILKKPIMASALTQHILVHLPPAKAASSQQ
jgi:two-component system, OmpR family, response regulator ChvI